MVATRSRHLPEKSAMHPSSRSCCRTSLAASLTAFSGVTAVRFTTAPGRKPRGWGVCRHRDSLPQPVSFRDEWGPWESGGSSAYFTETPFLFRHPAGTACARRLLRALPTSHLCLVRATRPPTSDQFHKFSLIARTCGAGLAAVWVPGLRLYVRSHWRVSPSIQPRVHLARLDSHSVRPWLGTLWGRGLQGLVPGRSPSLCGCPGCGAGGAEKVGLTGLHRHTQWCQDGAPAPHHMQMCSRSPRRSKVKPPKSVPPRALRSPPRFCQEALPPSCLPWQSAAVEAEASKVRVSRQPPCPAQACWPRTPMHPRPPTYVPL